MEERVLVANTEDYVCAEPCPTQGTQQLNQYYSFNQTIPAF